RVLPDPGGPTSIDCAPLPRRSRARAWPSGGPTRPQGRGRRHPPQRPAPGRRDVALAVEVFEDIVERSHISDPVFLDTRLTNHGSDQGGRDAEEVAEANDDAGLGTRSAL